MDITITSRRERDWGLILRRIIAYSIDVTILSVAVQAGQWGLMTLTGGFPYDQLTAANNGLLIYGWMLLTVSIPIWLYFILFEQSRWLASPGKRLLGLVVVTDDDRRASRGQLISRTVLKLLPWEIFHLTFMLPIPLLTDPDPGFRPGFVIGFAVMLLYLLVMAQTRRHKSIHDLISRTSVVGKQQRRLREYSNE